MLPYWIAGREIGPNPIRRTSDWENDLPRTARRVSGWTGLVQLAIDTKEYESSWIFEPCLTC
jgi:hypothetical protein